MFFFTHTHICTYMCIPLHRHRHCECKLEPKWSKRERHAGDFIWRSSPQSKWVMLTLERRTKSKDYALCGPQWSFERWWMPSPVRTPRLTLRDRLNPMRSADFFIFACTECGIYIYTLKIILILHFWFFGVNIWIIFCSYFYSYRFLKICYMIHIQYFDFDVVSRCNRYIIVWLFWWIMMIMIIIIIIIIMIILSPKNVGTWKLALRSIFKKKKKKKVQSKRVRKFIVKAI